MLILVIVFHTGIKEVVVMAEGDKVQIRENDGEISYMHADGDIHDFVDVKRATICRPGYGEMSCKLID